MDTQTKVAFGLYLAVAALSLAFACMYLLRSQFMPYHAAAVGRSWSQLDPLVQTLVLALMRVAGGGWLASGISVLLLVLIPLRRGEPWAAWAIPLVGAAAALPTFWATLMVRRRTPGSPPWYPSALCLAFLLLGCLLSWPF